MMIDPTCCAFLAAIRAKHAILLVAARLAKQHPPSSEPKMEQSASANPNTSRTESITHSVENAHTSV